MSTSQALDIQSLPFFARFLVEETPETPVPDIPPLPIWTLKWPSDWEES